jgi:hypothetical protein
MPESATDLIGVLLGLIALWFLLGSLLNDGRLRRQNTGHGRGRHHSSTRRPGAPRPAGH